MHILCAIENTFDVGQDNIVGSVQLPRFDPQCTQTEGTVGMLEQDASPLYTHIHTHTHMVIHLYTHTYTHGASHNSG